VRVGSLGERFHGRFTIHANGHPTHAQHNTLPPDLQIVGLVGELGEYVVCYDVAIPKRFRYEVPGSVFTAGPDTMKAAYAEWLARCPGAPPRPFTASERHFSERLGQALRAQHENQPVIFAKGIAARYEKPRRGSQKVWVLGSVPQSEYKWMDKFRRQLHRDASTLAILSLLTQAVDHYEEQARRTPTPVTKAAFDSDISYDVVLCPVGALTGGAPLTFPDRK
jgi:hypothetical protein